MARTRFPSLTPQTVAVIVGCVAFGVRYLLTGAVENDHFITLARALQLLYGDRPVRDFEDPGQPLAYLVSTAAAALFGPSLFVNIVLCILFLSLTAALTYVLAFRATGSTAAALLCAALTVVIYPRMYNTTKVIVPVIAIWLAWRYADAPSRRGLVEMALWTAVAFLLRHDYLLYVGLGSAALLVMRHVDAPQSAAAALAMYLGLSLAFISPWLVYVQWYEGIVDYFTSALRFVAAEGRRTENSSVSIAFVLLLMVPLLGLMASLRKGLHLTRAQLASASLMLLSLDVVFLRDVLSARIPDVVAPTAVVAAGVVGHFVSARMVTRSAIAAIAIVLVAAPIGLVATGRRVPTPLDVARRTVQVTERLEGPSAEIIPNPSIAPLVTYVSHCTRPDERVFVSGFGPEIPVLADRAFAAGLPTWIPGYYEDEADVERALRRLRDERLGAAVMLDGTAVVAHSWPQVMQSIRDRGFDEYTVPSVGPSIRVWLPRAVASAPRETVTGLPCPAL